ncbi:MAG: hydrogenase nickel incorporation protein HypA [Proteobacteria bacterium]|nr:hydrogenase nickel incorporation protein HypA [Pseudomonadota bacterium]
MHEWALAESVICTISDEINKNKLNRISRVMIKIGELQQIDIDIFRFALENVLESYELAVDKACIALETEPGTLKCNVCENEWSFEENIKRMQEDESEAIHFIPEIAHAYMRCPACGSPDFKIRKGRGVWIESIEGEI